MRIIVIAQHNGGVLGEELQIHIDGGELLSRWAPSIISVIPVCDRLF